MLRTMGNALDDGFNQSNGNIISPIVEKISPKHI